MPRSTLRPEFQPPVHDTDLEPGIETWKLQALRRVRQQLEHICSGPTSVPKSFCLPDAVRRAVAYDVDPETQAGDKAYDTVAEAIAAEIMLRPDLMEKFRAEFPEHDEAFLRVHAVPRWWCQTLCQLEGVHCGDIVGVVQTAIRRAEQA
jgi:hypothetical protein